MICGTNIAHAHRERRERLLKHTRNQIIDMHMRATMIMNQLQRKKLIILHFSLSILAGSILCLGLLTLQIAKEAQLCVREKLNVFAFYIRIHHFEPKVYPRQKTKETLEDTHTQKIIINTHETQYDV